MKVLMKPLQMVAIFKEDGTPTPVKFQVDKSVIVVQQILSKSEEKLAGNRMLIFRCQSEINGIVKPFELKYELQTCKWFLYKF